MPEGKGKIICKTGQVALFLENHGGGEVFKLGLLNDLGNMEASVFLQLDDAVFLQRCLNVCIDEIFAHNVRENWYGNETS